MSEPTPARQRAYDQWKQAVKTAHSKRVYFHRPWREQFANFIMDMGDPPPGTKLKRINNRAGYVPTNCCWE